MFSVAEIVATSIATLAFGLLLIIAILRLRSPEGVIVHLTLYVVFGLTLSGLVLVSLLSPTNPLTLGLSNSLVQLVALALIISFGALTLNFLKKKSRVLIAYWAIALIILALWGMLAFNVLGWSQTFAELNPTLAIQPTLILAGLGWVGALVVAFMALGADLRKRQPHESMTNSAKCPDHPHARCPPSADMLLCS